MTITSVLRKAATLKGISSINSLRVLLHLGSHPGERIFQVAHALDLDSGHVTTIASHLESHHLICRKRISARHTTLHLTSNGEASILQILSEG